MRPAEGASRRTQPSFVIPSSPHSAVAAAGARKRACAVWRGACGAPEAESRRHGGRAKVLRDPCM